MIITIEKTNYHVHIYGSGKPVIFLHGFSENMSTWKLNKIRGAQIIGIDLIGHGHSDVPAPIECYELRTIISHLNKIITKLGLVNYSMLGYSLGGRIALAYALKFQNHMNKLILESASYGEIGVINRYERRISDSLLAANIKSKGILWFNKYWSELSIFETQKNLPENILIDIENRRMSNDPVGLSNTLRATGQGTYPELKHRIKDLTLPVLYLSGELDKKYVQIGCTFESLNSNVIHRTIKNAGHNTHIESYKNFNKIVRLFIEGEKL